MVVMRFIAQISIILMFFIATDVAATNVDAMFADYIDYDTILSRDYLLKPYMDCIMERGKCNKDGKYLKKALPFIIKTECKYCTEKQKKKVAGLIQKFEKYQPNELANLKAKYDPLKYHWDAFQTLVDKYQH